MFQLIMLIFMALVIMYLLVILPKRNQEKQTRKLLDSLKKNDKVMTTSGMIGTIYAIDKQVGEVTLKVDDNVKIKFSLGAVYCILKEEDFAKDKKAEPVKDKN